jgi:hypothetical protein
MGLALSRVADEVLVVDPRQAECTMSEEFWVSFFFGGLSATIGFLAGFAVGRMTMFHDFRHFLNDCGVMLKKKGDDET